MTNPRYPVDLDENQKWAEKVAKEFHESYERQAPQFGYVTRKETAVPWENVLPPNKNLMIAVVRDLRERGVI
jgi:hypothetical protein